MMDKARNMKWDMMFYFLLTVCLTMVTAYAGWVYYYDFVDHTELWMVYGAISIFIGLFVGYFAAQKFQRKVDRIHLAVLQLSKGNLSGRIMIYGADSFDPLYSDFNEMSDSLEQRIKLLQKLGEENILLQTQSKEAAVMEERQRLARDLHDSVSQQLFAIHMSAASLPKIINQDEGKTNEVIGQLIQMSHYAQKQMRALLAQLRPMELEGESLSAALDKWFPDYCRQNNLQGSLNLELKEQLSEAIEQQLFLIIQEGMANIVKHASAKHVTLSLHDIGHQFILNLVDDGMGFDREAIKSNAYGLSTMRERAQKLGGDAEILSKPGAGARVKVHIPKFDS